MNEQCVLHLPSKVEEKCQKKTCPWFDEKVKNHCGVRDHEKDPTYGNREWT